MLISGSTLLAMASGNTLHDPPDRADFTSGNGNGRSVRPFRHLPPPFDQILDEYAAALERAPLAPASRSKYLSRVRGFLAWLAASAVDGDPLAEPAARDWEVRDYRGHLKTVGRASPATIKSTTRWPRSTTSTPGSASARPPPAARTCPSATRPAPSVSGRRGATCAPSRPTPPPATAPSALGLRRVEGLAQGDGIGREVIEQVTPLSLRSPGWRAARASGGRATPARPRCSGVECLRQQITATTVPVPV
jgi:hypothetical protein